MVLVAADRMEIDPFVRKWETVQELRWGVAFARRGRFKGQYWVCVANGAGAGNARVAASRVVAQGVRALGWVSTGFAGALNGEYRLGDRVGGESVTCERTGRRFDCALPEWDGPARTGAVLTADRVVTTAAEKRTLNERGFDAVEMEASAVAEIANSRSERFYCLRSISDTAVETMAIDFNRARDSAGGISKIRVVAQAAASGVSGIGGLVRLRRQAGVAAIQLGDFLACCRFS